MVEFATELCLDRQGIDRFSRSGPEIPESDENDQALLKRWSKLIHSNGYTKAAVEQMLSGLHASALDALRIACLRYFKAVSAHPSGRIRESPLGIPNNLFPFVSQMAVGRKAQHQVFGRDWPTSDDTGVRDTFQVIDLVEGHRAALNCLLADAPQLLGWLRATE